MHVPGTFGNQRLGQITFYLYGAHTATEFRAVARFPGAMGNQRCNRDIAFAYGACLTLLDVAEKFTKIVFELSNICCYHSRNIGQQLGQVKEIERKENKNENL